MKISQTYIFLEASTAIQDGYAFVDTTQAQFAYDSMFGSLITQALTPTAILHRSTSRGYELGVIHNID